LVKASDFAGVEVSGNCAGVKFSGDYAGVSSRAREEACKRRSWKQARYEDGLKGGAGGAVNVRREASGEMRGKGSLGKLAIKLHLRLMLWEKLKKFIRPMLGNRGSRS
jgi:hypothetical protein